MREKSEVGGILTGSGLQREAASICPTLILVGGWGGAYDRRGGKVKLSKNSNNGKVYISISEKKISSLRYKRCLILY